ncbi:MAG: hypothetical protein HY020_24720 [Burkholderiales bacterium]|nr:hypothetical protein [Burkholderiales bacterium]
MNTVILAILSILISVAAQFSLKAGMSGVKAEAGAATLFTMFTNKFVLLGFLLYGLGAVVWLGVLSKWEVSKAYPMVGLGFAMTAVVGMLIGEQVSLLRMGGVALICTGVVLVARS